MKKLILFALCIGLLILLGVFLHPREAHSDKREAQDEAIRAPMVEVGQLNLSTSTDATQDDIGPRTSQDKTRTFRAVVTAYNAVPEQTDGTPCISASGDDICALLERGDRTCASRHAFGTVLIIPGLGRCVVRDRTAPKYRDRVDVFFGGREHIQDAKTWGKQTLILTISN